MVARMENVDILVHTASVMIILSDIGVAQAGHI